MDSDPEELYGKRKKKKLKCPNPLFEQWLTEWRDEAALKGWKSQFNFGKALATLKKFPLPLANGKECKMLKNFGDKTCKMLETKLAEHVALYGTTAPVSATTTSSTNVTSLSSSTVTSTNHITPSSIMSTNTASTSHITGVDSSDSDTVDNLVNARPPKKRRKSSGNTEYIPSYRTGPYAILLALYTNRQDANCKGYLTKTELIRLAQPLTDTSLTEPDPANAQRYTGWSSMSTLIKKNLVYKERSPAQFSLTEAGCNLAHRLQHVDRKSTFSNQSDHLHTDDTPTLPSLDQSNSDTTPILPSLHQSNDWMDVESESRITDVSPPSENDNR
ncbi:crossover junction endonuclease MUS81-like [Patella vulgata]|uniref:crossover junction endonuclease MUS81-like n=1 Tax=Patella vulgata TaxID=6465 RepID=UPI0024A89E7C|nr:crossover junction endonuclease MUS81-like [Patella vulgata]